MFEKLFGFEKCGDAWLKFEEKNEYGGYVVAVCKPGATDCIIPSTYKGEDVVGIAEEAFCKVNTLVSITIPDTIRFIGSSAFSADGKSALREVHISSLAAWCKIDFKFSQANPLWYAGHLFLGGEEVTRLVIPDGVEYIQSFSFAGLKGITEVVVPSSVSWIGARAFSNCDNLSRVELSEGLTEIRNEAFASCTSLHEVILPRTLKTIGSSAFANCPSLSGIDIPDSVESIEYAAFKGSFTNGVVRIGRGLKYIGGYAFSSGRIAKVYIADMDTWSELQLSTCSPVGGDTVVFYGEWEMEEFAFKNGIYEIKTGALANFGELLSVYIPASVRKIENGAFSRCSIHTLHYGGTEKQWRQIDVNIDDGNEGLRHIEEWVYSSRPFGVDATKHEAEEKTSDVEDMPYDGRGTVTLGDAEVWVKLTDDGRGWIITECQNKSDKPTKLILPALLGGKPIVEIADFLFMEGMTYKDMDRFTTLRLSDSVRRIGGSAFEGCSALVDVRLGSGLCEIGRSAFQGCSALEEIDLPEGLVCLETAAFMDCTSLRSFEVPSTTVDLFEGVIGNCPNIRSLSVREGNPDYHSDRDCIISDRFATLYLGCTDSVIPMDGTVECIGYGAFEHVNVKRLVIPVGVTRIEPYAFASSGIEDITIPNTVTNIGTSIFYNCESLVKISLPEGLTTVPDGMFRDCTSLKEVYIPSSVGEIEAMAFSGCSALAVIKFGGTREEWEKIKIGEDNEPVASCEIIFAE